MTSVQWLILAIYLLALFLIWVLRRKWKLFKKILITIIMLFALSIGFKVSFSPITSYWMDNFFYRNDVEICEAILLEKDGIVVDYRSDSYSYSLSVYSKLAFIYCLSNKSVEYPWFQYSDELLQMGIGIETIQLDNDTSFVFLLLDLDTELDTLTIDSEAVDYTYNEEYGYFYFIIPGHISEDSNIILNGYTLEYSEFIN
ncbi:MAG: hypothetical protein KJ971_03935 [Firmicutes bacterium]|nr:hypothetical protein [Bacillota bacterium]